MYNLQNILFTYRCSIFAPSKWDHQSQHTLHFFPQQYLLLLFHLRITSFTSFFSVIAQCSIAQMCQNSFMHSPIERPRRLVSIFCHYRKRWEANPSSKGMVALCRLSVPSFEVALKRLFQPVFPTAMGPFMQWKPLKHLNPLIPPPQILPGALLFFPKYEF